jgi:hypothetical protein
MAFAWRLVDADGKWSWNWRWFSLFLGLIFCAPLVYIVAVIVDLTVARRQNVRQKNKVYCR